MAEMNITLADLIPLLPLILATATVVVTMLAVAVRRNYVISATITIVGLIVSATAALLLIPDTNQQVTPLMVVDQYSLLFTVLSCLVAAAIAILSFPYFIDLNDHREEYYLLLGLATVGAIVMVSSSHFVSLVLGLETLSMSLYGMVAYPLHTKNVAKYPLEAAIKYLVLSAAASAILLFGVALIYAQTGSLSFASLVDSAEFSAGFSVMAALLLTVGIAFKLSLAPFHVWTPDVYEGAPLPATSYLATLGKVAVFVVLLRWLVSSDALAHEAVAGVLSLLAAASILGGNLLALLQANLKRILAYSSIAHMGYVLVAVVATAYAQDTIAVEAVSFYLIAYSIMTLGAFGITATISSSEKEFDVIHDYRGLFWRAPWLAALFTATLLSLAGIPLTVGFIGKFYLFYAAVEAGLWMLLLAMVLGSGIGLYYYLRIVYRMCMPAKEHSAYRVAGIESLSSYVVLALVFLLILVLGVYPAPLMNLVAVASTLI
ncbi:MAG: NADH-quinone oxidoreductase subunit NuoN [Pseudohongiellaceae bacterium]|jgi:NADH-quinone oxidoreductase subunit N